MLLDHAILSCMSKMNSLQASKDPDFVESELWNWIQKSKARAINDLIGVGATIPGQMISMAKQNIRGTEMLHEWTKMRKQLRGKQNNVYPASEAWKKINELELAMQEIPELENIISLIRGKAVNTEEMNTLLETLPEEQRSRVILVDWYERVTYGDDPKKLSMILHRYRATPQLFELDPALLDKARAWVEQFSGNIDQGTTDWNTAWKEAQKVGALVAPLASATKRNDILVLCPTGILHRFPLHALLLPVEETSEDQGCAASVTLLERNMPIFTHSLSLFRLCVYARTNISKSAVVDEAPFRAAIVTPLIDGDPSIDELSRFLRCEDFQGETVNRQQVINLCENADLFHFYGHVHRSGEANPMNSHLLLFTGKDPRDDAACNGTHDETAMLSARDIVSHVRFREGAHVNLIACDSGVSYAARGDEMLGLIPATLMAGARSVCGTLWAIERIRAYEWTKLLIDDWKWKRRDEGYSDLIDLASCARNASLSIMYQDEGNREHHMERWAPYVYHGFWQIQDPIG